MSYDIEFWSATDDEILSHETVDEAVESFLEDCDQFPETIEIRGYARMQPSPDVLRPLEDLLEYLDEEYGDPDGPPTEATAKMKEAERAFINVVLQDYSSWACEQVTTEIILVNEWIGNKRPEWLE